MSILKNTLNNKGFINSQIDTLFKKDSIYTALFDLNTSINILTLHYTKTIEPSIIKKYRLTFRDNKIILKWDLIASFLNDLLESYQKKGFPFTQIKLKNIFIKNNASTADIEITSFQQRYIDSIVVKGYDQFPKSFLKYYLALKPQTLFNTSKLNTASKRLKTLSFVENIKPPEILFTQNKTDLYLYLKKKPSNTFDGLIGFASKENGKGLIFNGYLDINLINSLNTGEKLSILFKSNGNDQQSFNLKTEFPYAFNSRITPHLDFKINKQDSSFVKVEADLGVKYPLNYKSSLGILLNLESSSNLLTQEINSIKSYSSYYYGISYNFKSFYNDDLSSEKFSLNAHILKGTKTLNNSTENQIKLELTASYLWRVNYKNAFYIKGINGLLDANNYVQNELFRIGGFNSIRGFNEESIFASKYTILNLEYRYNTTNSDYLYTITDFANYTSPLLNLNTNLYSFGIGYKFSSKIGVLNISYALGKSSNQTFNIKDAQFHVNLKTAF